MNHYGHNVDLTQTPAVCTDCDNIELDAQGNSATMYEEFQNYHKKFTKIKINTLLATKSLFSGKFYSLSDEAKQRRCEAWLSDVSDIYGVPVPTFRIGTTEEAHGSGVYFRETATIILPRFSIVTLMHEFRHHMQAQGIAPTRSTLKAIEDDARAWSLSLYFSAKPKLFKKSVLEGKIMYVNPKEVE